MGIAQPGFASNRQDRRTRDRQLPVGRYRGGERELARADVRLITPPGSLCSILLKLPENPAKSVTSRDSTRNHLLYGGVVGAISEHEEWRMNWDRIEGNWKTFKGQVRQKWGKLTDDDLDVIEGKRTELSGRLQERYGYAQDEAEKNIDTWLKSIN
jgi:uncharacterized protein YjbJ (UPF0337 family)